MKKIILFCFMLCGISTFAQMQLYTSKVTSHSAQINFSPDLIPSSGIYLGAYNPHGEEEQFVADAGHSLAIRHKFLAWGSSYNFFDENMMNNLVAKGAIPFITWEPWNYQIVDANYQLADIINGNFDNYIRQWASEAAAWGKPFFLRFGHEMNGKTWYPWQEGFNGNTSGQFVQAYRKVVDIFRQQGANNAIFVWGVNVSFYGSTPLSGLYPGDDYVGWVSVNGYNRGGSSWKSFSQIYTNTINEINQIAPDKPQFIGEISSSETGGNKAGWITDAFGVQIPNSNFKAAVWFNSVDNNDYRIQSSPAAKSAFAAAVTNPIYLGSNTAPQIAGYEIKLRKQGSSGWQVLSPTGYSHNASELTSATTYEFAVRTKLADGSYRTWSASSFFTTQTVTSIASSSSFQSEIKLFPVPFSDEATLLIKTESTVPVSITVIDVLGAVVEYSDEHTSNVEIRFGSQLPSGTYFLKIKAGDAIREKRFVKVK